MSGNAFGRFRAALEANGFRIRETGGAKAQAQCPAHDDSNPSLSIDARSDGKGIVINCHAGCGHKEVLSSLGLEESDLFDEPQIRSVYNRTRDYTYPDGRVSHRRPPKAAGGKKQFFQSGNTNGDALFHGDKTGHATTIFITEGEKDAEAIEAIGGTAVCSAQGAGSARKANWSALSGRNVVIVEHQDKAGRKYRTEVSKCLGGVPASIKFVRAAAGNDAADHIAAGFGLDDFVEIDPDGYDRPRVWRTTELAPARQAEWLGRQWLPRAAITILVGEEGIGKSLCWVAIARAITTGEAQPAFGIPAREPGVVVLVITEDDWAETVQPRLEVAGVNLGNIRVICQDRDGSGSPTFPRDLDLIRQMTPAPVLVVVDAWLDTVPRGLSVRDPQGAREALHPLKELATATRCAVLLVTHTNRLATANARDKYGATSELRKKARMALFAQRDDDGRLVVGPEKSNTAAATYAVMCAIESVQHFEATPDDDGTVGRLKILQASTKTAREHLADNFEAAGEDRQDRQDAVGWLRAYLTLHAPSRPSAEIKREAHKVGIAERTLQRARKDLGVIVSYSGIPATSSWALPESDGDAEGGDNVSDLGVNVASDEASSVSVGISGVIGITAGQIAVPGYANPESGTTLAQLSDQQLCREKLVMPRIKVTGPSRCDECSWHIPTQGHSPECSSISAQEMTV